MAEAEAAAPSRWPDLPPDLTGLSLLRLPFLLDRLSFSSVCRAWRLLPPPPPPPLLRSRDDDTFQRLTAANNEPPRRLFTAPAGAAAAATVLIRCYDDWLLYCNVLEDTFFLFNPLAGATVANVPLLRNDGPDGVAVKHPIKKIIACSPDLLAGIFGGGDVAFYRPGTGATSWSVCPSVHSWSWGWCLDIALYRGKIFALKSTNELFFYELGGGGGAPEYVSLAHPPPLKDPTKELSDSMGHLVVSRGKLLMVRWSVPSSRMGSPSSAGVATEGTKLLVFEADLEVGRWQELHDLDGRALFVGRGCSKALTLTGDDERLRGNRVYFLGDCCRLNYDNPSYGFYDLKTGTISQVFLDRGSNKRPYHGMDWFFPCV